MSHAKLNVLHWHLTDWQSFPLATPKAVSRGLTRGAYSASETYSAEDLRGIVSYAADRAIRVIPELDMPAHTEAWRHGIPIIKCPHGSSVITPVGDDRVDEVVKDLIG